MAFAKEGSFANRLLIQFLHHSTWIVFLPVCFIGAVLSAGIRCLPAGDQGLGNDLAGLHISDAAGDVDQVESLGPDNGRERVENAKIIADTIQIFIVVLVAIKKPIAFQRKFIQKISLDFRGVQHGVFPFCLVAGQSLGNGLAGYRAGGRCPRRGGTFTRHTRTGVA